MQTKFLVTALVVSGVLLMSAAFGLPSLFVRNEKAGKAPIPTASTKPVVAPSIPAQNIDQGSYKRAIAQATSAANLVQSTSSQDDWKLIVSRWQKSISLLKSIAKEIPSMPKLKLKQPSTKRI